MSETVEKQAKKHFVGSRIIGIVLMIAAVFGWIISLAGIYGLVWVRPRAISATNSGLQTLRITLKATNNLLGVIDSTLVSANSGLDAVSETLHGFGRSLQATSDVMDSVSTTLTVDIDKVLKTTIKAMDGLEATTRMVDTTLNLVSAIPFLGLNSYSPTTTLSSSVSSISKSMTSMPTSFDLIGNDLKTTSKVMQPIPDSLTKLTGELANIQTSVASAQNIVRQYQTSLTDLQKNVENAIPFAPTAINIIFGAILALMIWVFLAQIGLFTQGLERMRQ